ncbi:hypothetical protein OTK53_21930 [Vibrio mediterranei]|nr:hypothetical protein [Vibrio mediterranei]
MPSQTAPYLMLGEIDKGFLWNPADVGYAMVTVASKNRARYRCTPI